LNKSVATGADRTTIFALASAPGPAGVAVWRVSGARASAAFTLLCDRALPAPRRMTRIHVRHPATGEVFDDGFAVWFPGPASFTGEDTLELYVHGGRAVARAMTTALSAIDGLRGAKAGEFTRRALEAGKLDLTQAEGIADLVAAETEAQHRQARRQLDGALGALYDGWKREILGILARFEAGMDFPDEDIPAEIFARMRPRMESLSAAMTAHLDDHRRGERIRDGVRVAVTGAPNVGKSSLVNALAQRDVAIVSHRPGTTRDVVEVALDLAGLPVVIADTAGIREADDEIEAEGVRRARAWAASADIVLTVIDGQSGLTDGQVWVEPGPESEARPGAGDAEKDRGNALVPGRTVVVVNKIDATPEARRVQPANRSASVGVDHTGRGLNPPELSSGAGVVPADGPPVVFVSARTGEGLPSLLDVLEKVSGDLLGHTEAASITRARHRAGVAAAVAALSQALGQSEVELAGEDLRHALRALGQITGDVGVEDVLDVVFREFCIGK
jgi:tRNA modification GTPase